MLGKGPRVTKERGREYPGSFLSCKSTSGNGARFSGQEGNLSPPMMSRLHGIFTVVGAFSFHFFPFLGVGRGSSQSKAFFCER